MQWRMPGAGLVPRVDVIDVSDDDDEDDVELLVSFCLHCLGLNVGLNKFVP